MMVQAFLNLGRKNRRAFGLWVSLSGFLLGCGEPEQIREYMVPKMAVDGSSSRPAGKERMLAAMIPHDGMAWYFKLTGPDDSVQDQAEGFLSLIQSVTFASNGRPQWKLPAKWKQEGQAGMRFATIKIPDANAVEMTVIPLPMPEGGNEEDYKLENVNRWRGQLGLAPIGEADLQDQIVEVPLQDSNAKAMVVNLLGEKSPATPGQPPFANMSPEPAEDASQSAESNRVAKARVRGSRKLDPREKRHVQHLGLRDAARRAKGPHHRHAFGTLGRFAASASQPLARTDQAAARGPPGTR